MKTKVGSLKAPWALYMGVEKGKAEEVEGEVRKCKISRGKRGKKVAFLLGWKLNVPGDGPLNLEANSMKSRLKVE